MKVENPEDAEIPEKVTQTVKMNEMDRIRQSFISKFVMKPRKY